MYLKLLIGFAFNKLLCLESDKNIVLDITSVNKKRNGKKIIFGILKSNSGKKD